MLRIAVCDDDINDLKKAVSYLEVFLSANDTEYSVVEFSDGTQLLESSDIYDILFLDIEMKHSNGINIAETLRSRNIDTPIVYITSYTDYWRRAFKVHAFGFITKPFDKSDFDEVLNDYFESVTQSGKNRITLNTSEGAVCLDPDEIIYFYVKSKRNIELHTLSAHFLIRENLSDIYDRLDKKHFYQPRRECIINLKNVRRLQNDYAILMVDGSILPLAQRKKDEFMTLLTDVFTEVVKGQKG